MNEHTTVVRRRFTHPPEKVWQAWTEAARLDRWFGPEGFVTTTERIDFRVGGDWVFTMAHPVYGAFDNHVRYLEIEPPRRLVYEHLGEGGFRSEVELEESAGGTVLTLRSIFPSAEALRVVVEQFNAVEGGRQTISKLETELGRAPRVRVACFAISMDGYGAGTDQSLEHPLGRGGTALHDWFRPTRTFHAMLGQPGGSYGLDDDWAARGIQRVGAWILGRNMFAPSRGPWTDDGWRGWWGDEPPYHTPVFVLSHHPRDPLPMAGGTTFHFVPDGIEAALERAKAAAGDGDVRIGGGVSTVRQYLRAGLVDEVHLAQSDAVLGSGEALFDGLDLPALGYRVAERAQTEGARHVLFVR